MTLKQKPEWTTQFPHGQMMPEIVVQERQTWTVNEDLWSWFYDQLNDNQMSAEVFLSKYVEYNGIVRAIRLFRKLFDMDLRSAKDYCDARYEREKQLYWERENFRRIHEDWKSVDELDER